MQNSSNFLNLVRHNFLEVKFFHLIFGSSCVESCQSNFRSSFSGRSRGVRHNDFTGYWFDVAVISAESLIKIETVWETLSLPLLSYRGDNKYILGDLEELFVVLEDHQVMLQSMLASKDVTESLSAKQLPSPG